MVRVSRRPRILPTTSSSTSSTTLSSKPVAALTLGLAVALTGGLAGCTGGGSPAPTSRSTLAANGADPAAQQAATALATALSQQDVSTLSWSGLSGAQAQTDFSQATAALGTVKLAATASAVRTDGDTGTVSLDLSWTFPGVSKAWTYPVTAQLARVNGSWADVWAPTLVQPRLTGGATLTMKRTQAERGDILDGDGKALMKERPVVRIGLDKTRVSAAAAPASAAELADLVGIDSANYVAAVKAAGSKAFVPAIVFREDADDRPSTDDLDEIDGAVSLDDTAVLSPARGFASALLGSVGEASEEVIEKSDGTIAAGDQVGLSGLESRYEAQLGGTPSVQVSVVAAADASASPSAAPSSSTSATPAPSASPGPATVLFSSTGRAGTDLELTMSTSLQALAEDALSEIKPDSALVAVQPSTGKILAAASGPGADGANSATYGQYPPGSTFKLASSLALLRAGDKPTTAVDCPATVKVNGQTFKNYDDYPSSKEGRIDLETAVANSCNTAFIGSRDELSGSDLADAAATLGIGTDYDVGFPAYFGSVPSPASENEKAASMIGQGKVQASPMAMAGAIASVQEGRTVLPYLIAAKRPASKAEPLTGTEAKQLQTLLGAVVSEGSGATLQSLEPPAVIAKTGTAEYGTDDPPQTHAWMVAAQGDLAVAVFVGKGDSGSGVAGPILTSFLKSAR